MIGKQDVEEIERLVVGFGPKLKELKVWSMVGE